VLRRHGVDERLGHEGQNFFVHLQDSFNVQPGVGQVSFFAAAPSVLTYLTAQNIDWQRVEKYYMDALFFVMSGGQTLSDCFSGISTWSALRDGLKERLASAHRASLPTSVVFNKTRQAAVSQNMVHSVKESEAKYLEVVQGRCADATMQDAVKGWLQINCLEMPANMHPAYTEFATAAFKACHKLKKEMGAPLPLPGIVQIVASQLGALDSIGAYRDQLCRDLPILLASSTTFPSCLTELFEDKATAQAFCTNRTHYALSAFKQLLVPAFVAEPPFTQLEAIEKLSDMVAAVDIHKSISLADDANSWAKFWHTCLVANGHSELEALLQHELQAAKRRYNSDLQQYQESAANNALVAALDGKDAGERTNVLDDMISVQQFLTDISTLWDQLLPRAEDGAGALLMPSHMIPASCRVSVVERLLSTISMIFLKHSADRGKVTCDSSLDMLMFDESGDRPGLWAKTATTDISLSFNGHFSLVPTVGSFEVCRLGEQGLSIYVRSNCPKGLVTSFFNPAWKVRTVPYNMDTGVQSEPPTMRFETSEHPVCVTYNESFLSPQRSLSVTVKMPRLLLDASYDGQENLELTRPYHDNEIFDASAAKHYKKEVAQKTKALKSSGLPATSKEWKQFAAHVLA